MDVLLPALIGSRPSDCFRRIQCSGRLMSERLYHRATWPRAAPVSTSLRRNTSCPFLELVTLDPNCLFFLSSFQETTFPKTPSSCTGRLLGSPSAFGRHSLRHSSCVSNELSRRTTTWWEQSESSSPTLWACQKHRYTIRAHLRIHSGTHAQPTF